MTNVLLTGCSCSINKGAAAMVISTVKMLKRFIPDAKFTMLSPFPELDSKQCSKYAIDVVDYKALRSINPARMLFCLFRCALWSALSKYLQVNVNVLIKGKVLQEYAKSDIIIDLSGDALNHGFVWSIVSFGTILLGISMGKPAVIYPQSIGPFTRTSKYLARFALNKVNFITAREEITKDYLKKMGIDKIPVHLTGDIAFLLPQASNKGVHEIFLNEGISEDKRPIIGMAISQSIAGYSKTKRKQAITGQSKYKDPRDIRDSYIHTMVQVVGYLTDVLDATVVFVPHVVGPGKEHDDRVIGADVLARVKNKQKVVLITREYTPEELKGIIGQCDLFIGARMHANIAATSMHVPTIGIGYSYKFNGIMEMVGLEDYICDIRSLKFEELIPKINDAWANREEIKRELKSKIEILQEQTLLNCKLVKDILDHNYKEQIKRGREHATKN